MCRWSIGMKVELWESVRCTKLLDLGSGWIDTKYQDSVKTPQWARIFDIMQCSGCQPAYKQSRARLSGKTLKQEQDNHACKNPARAPPLYLSCMQLWDMPRLILPVPILDGRSFWFLHIIWQIWCPNMVFIQLGAWWACLETPNINTYLSSDHPYLCCT